MDLEIPDTICELLDRRDRLSPMSVACISHSHDGQTTVLQWRDFRERVLQLAGALQGLVEQPGTVVAVRMPSSFNYELLSHALMRLGCVLVGVDYQASAADVRSVLERCQAKLLITDAALFAESKLTVASCVQSVILTDDAPSTADLKCDWYRLSELVDSSVDRPEPDCALPQGRDLATIVFTSGTTGEPKGIPFRHEQIMAACRAVYGAYPELGPEDSTICWLPLSALFQRMVNLLSMACGMRTHFISDPRRIFAELARLQPTFLVGVPRFYEKLQDALADESNSPLRACAASVKYMISGSAPLPRTLLDSLQKSGVLVLEAYGLSENAIPIAANLASDFRFGSVGKPLAPNQLRLAADGEVEVKSIGVFSGYFGQESSDCFTEDGYYRSGDLGAFDDDGFLFLTGRKRDLFKTSTGRRIGPSRIEAIYSACPSIDQVVVIGDNQKYLAALVTLKPTATSDAKAAQILASELLAEIRSVDQSLSEHERVQAIGILSRPFQADEVTSSMKLKRDVIVSRYATFISRLYSMPTPCVLHVLPEEM